ncbi:MAG TPA: hypothetical protein EYG92_07980 [Lutibacter sp.]|nr:hypothetical protein [Lutibacter sp.]
MNKYIIVLIGFSLLLNSCKAIDSLTQFTMEYDQVATINATIPIPIGLLNIPTPKITTNSESKFQSEDTHKDLVEQAILKTLELEITSPTNGDFNFLESIKVYISAADLDEILIASLINIPEGLKVIELNSEGQNLEAYIKKDEISLRVETVTDEILTRDYDLKIHSEFFIDAKILGI